MTKLRQTVLGYDPGGNSAHGVAALYLLDGIPERVEVQTLSNASKVIAFFEERKADTVCIGIDTLTCWSTGPSGWRPADRFLRRTYPKIQNSVASANSLRGSMAINGAAVLLHCKEHLPELLVTEAHPKVLYWHLTGRPYRYGHEKSQMDSFLSEFLKLKVETESEHEWDALICAAAAFKGRAGEWTLDLHSEKPQPDELLIKPVGESRFFWPQENKR